MFKWILENKAAIGIVFLIWFAVGFILGIMNTFDVRSNTEEKIPAGCVYKSAATLTSPGYIAACELFRRRWYVDGVQDLFQKK